MTAPDSSNSRTAVTTNQSGMTLQELETAASWANVSVVALTVLAAVAAVFALYFSMRAGALKDEALERFKADSAASIASANARVAEAEKGTADAIASAAKINERANGLELESSKQHERAAKAELELLELQQRLAPRRLSEAQALTLIRALKGVVVKVPTPISCVLGDGEGLEFASQIDVVLKAAGWPTALNQGAFSPQNPIGFFVRIRSAAAPPTAVLALQKAFGAIGIELPTANKADLPDGAFEIVVGNKPR